MREMSTPSPPPIVCIPGMVGMRVSVVLRLRLNPPSPSLSILYIPLAPASAPLSCLYYVFPPSSVAWSAPRAICALGDAADASLNVRIATG